MKKLKQTFCLLLAVALLGASLCMPAAAEEAQQQPVQVVTMNGDGDVVPYATYIRSIYPISVYKQTSTTLCFSALVQTYGNKLTYKGTVTVQKQAGSTFYDIMSDTQSYYGTGPFTYKFENYVYTPGVYRAKVTVQVYNSSNALLETQTATSAAYQF